MGYKGYQGRESARPSSSPVSRNSVTRQFLIQKPNYVVPPTPVSVGVVTPPAPVMPRTFQGPTDSTTPSGETPLSILRNRQPPGSNIAPSRTPHGGRRLMIYNPKTGRSTRPGTASTAMSDGKEHSTKKLEYRPSTGSVRSPRVRGVRTEEGAEVRPGTAASKSTCGHSSHRSSRSGSSSHRGSCSCSCHTRNRPKTGDSQASTTQQDLDEEVKAVTGRRNGKDDYQQASILTTNPFVMQIGKKSPSGFEHETTRKCVVFDVEDPKREFHPMADLPSQAKDNGIYGYNRHNHLPGYTGFAAGSKCLDLLPLERGNSELRRSCQKLSHHLSQGIGGYGHLFTSRHGEYSGNIGSQAWEAYNPVKKDWNNHRVKHDLSHYNETVNTVSMRNLLSSRQ